MPSILELLKHTELVLRSVVVVCSVYGVFTAIGDLRTRREVTEEFDPKAKRRVSAFLIICIMMLLYAPGSFERLLDLKLVGAELGQFCRTLAAALSLVYFYLIMIERLVTYKLERRVIIYKAVCILLAIVLLVGVGFLSR